MQPQSRAGIKLVATGFVVGGVIACVAAGFGMRLREATVVGPIDPVLSAADVVALRFPDELAEGAPPAAASADDAQRDEALALFSPYPTYPTASLDAQDASLAASPQSTPPDAAPSPPPAPLANVASRFAAAPAHRGDNRAIAVLSEGQIASIKRRLKLTPEQQQMWPAVEVALRSLTYPKKSDGAHKNNNADDARLATIDSTSPEVQQLTSAAYPMVMSFSDDQKRELHVLAHVVGLEQLVPKF